MTLNRVCTLFQLPVRGGHLFEDVGGSGRNALVFRLEGGKLAAYAAECPHAGALMRPENEMSGVLTCFLHQWQFDISTGRCLNVPPHCLTRYPVEVQGVDVFLNLDPNPT